MSKYNIKMVVVAPTNMPNKKSIEVDLHRFVIADNLRKMLYRAVSSEKDFTRVKHLNVEIENEK